MLFLLKRMIHRRKMQLTGNERGFTLIEVLISVAFFMVIVGGIIMAISTSSKVLALANNKEISKDIASGVMEYIKTRPYASTYNLNDPGDPYIPPAEYSNFTTNVVVTYLRFGEEQIDITVSLNGKNIFTLTDYRTNY
jgi:Tfp pilus assembly protein PilV